MTCILSGKWAVSGPACLSPLTSVLVFTRLWTADHLESSELQLLVFVRSNGLPLVDSCILWQLFNSFVVAAGEDFISNLEMCCDLLNSQHTNETAQAKLNNCTQRKRTQIEAKWSYSMKSEIFLCLHQQLRCRLQMKTGVLIRAFQDNGKELSAFPEHLLPPLRQSNIMTLMSPPLPLF